MYKIKPFIYRGTCRIVIIIGKYAIKIPNFLSSKPAAIVFGLMENLQERTWFISDYTQIEMTNKYPISKIYHADPLGLFIIAERCRPLNDYEWSSPETLKVIEWGSSFAFANDIKRSNFGITDDGRIVFIDYGYVCRTCNIGDMAIMVNGHQQTILWMFIRLHRFIVKTIWSVLEWLNIAILDNDIDVYRN